VVRTETKEIYKIAEEYVRKIIDDERFDDNKDRILLVNLIKFVLESSMSFALLQSLKPEEIKLIIMSRENFEKIS